MGKLAHIRQAMEKPKSLDGLVENIADHVAGVIAEKLSGDMSRGASSLAEIRSAIEGVSPIIESAVREAFSASVAEVIKSLGDHETKNRSELKAATDRLIAAQESVSRALGRVKIPDYSEAIAKLGKVDFSEVKSEIGAKVSEVLSRLDVEERPLKWRFEVKRNKRTDLIESVTATAED